MHPWLFVGKQTFNRGGAVIKDSANVRPDEKMVNHGFKDPARYGVIDPIAHERAFRFGRESMFMKPLLVRAK